MVCNEIRSSLPEDTKPVSKADPPTSKAYIHTLPLELIGSIATILSSLDPHSVWTFASVCHYWRDAALCFPSCWARIHVKDTVQDLLHFKDPKTALWLSRAKESELELRLDDNTSHLLMFEPLNTISLSRIGRLHLGSWDPSLANWISWGSLKFDALKVLSVRGWSRVNNCQIDLSTIVTTFIAQDNEEGKRIFAPYLEELALSDVHIDISTFPKLSTLQTLKLVRCHFDYSVHPMGFISQAKENLKRLCMVDTTQKLSVYSSPKTSGITEVEFPLLTSLTLLIIVTSTSITEFIQSFRCPSLKHLTCSDRLTAHMFKSSFPSLSHLSLSLSPNYTIPSYERLISTLNPSSCLTIYRSPACVHGGGLNNLIWSMINSPTMGSNLKGMRFVSVRAPGVTKTLLDSLNRSRRRRNPDGERFANELAMRGHDTKDEIPWDTDAWWTREGLWAE